jgi:hypothetical protein
MATTSSSFGGDRKTGKVTRVLRDYGFISCPEVDKEVYFKAAWFRGNPPLRENDTVEGELTSFRNPDGTTNWIMRDLIRVGDALPEAGVRSRPRLPSSGRLFDWAYLGYLPNVLAELAGLALKGEQWEFKNSPHNPERPLPILLSYLFHTFGRLVLEKKVLVNDAASLAAFNTGLVDQRYEKIYALFSPNDNARVPGDCPASVSPVKGQTGRTSYDTLSHCPHRLTTSTTRCSCCMILASESPSLTGSTSSSIESIVTRGSLSKITCRQASRRAISPRQATRNGAITTFASGLRLSKTAGRIGES